MFGVSMTLLWVLFLAAGFVIVALSTNGPETVQAFCDGHIQDDKLKFIEA